jgi:multidrug resistance efflux pump
MKAPLPATTPRRKIILSALVFGGIALAGVLVVLYAWNLPPFHSTIQSTENALVRGQVTLISPQLSGYVVEVAVQDFQTVKEGALIMRIDDRIYRQRVEQGEAQVAAAKTALANFANAKSSAEATIRQGQAAVANADAQAARAAADERRVEELASDGSLSARERDQTRAARAQSVAGGAQARAALDIARQSLQTVTTNRGSLEAAVANAEAGADRSVEHARAGAPRRPVGPGHGAARRLRQRWCPGHGPGAGPVMGHRQYEGNPDGPRGGGSERRVHGGRPRQRPPARPRRAHRARHGL